MAKVSEKKSEGKKEKKQTSFSLIIILIVAVFLTAGYFLIWPEYQKLSDDRNKLAAGKEALASQNKTLADLQKLFNNYEDISEANKEKIISMLPSEVDEPGLFALVETLAEKNKMVALAVDISEKDPSADLKNLGLKEVHLAVNLIGGEYINLKNFLGDLETNLRLLDVISVNYTPEAGSVILNVKTYRLDAGPITGVGN
jgi:Tfp pilus assembly protein PilO